MEQHLLKVLNREKEHSPVALGSQGRGRRQQGAKGYSSQESFQALRALDASPNWTTTVMARCRRRRSNF
jgi:hypothetical protein